jgi:hypothetical protein
MRARKVQEVHMRITAIAINVLGAILLCLGGAVACAIHKTHSLSVTVELEKRAGPDGKKVTHFLEGDPRLPDGTYDPVERIRSTGNVESSLTWLCGFGGGVRLANAVGWAFFSRPKPAPPLPLGGQGGTLP